MPKTFGGLYKHKVDDKGRVSLPARLRRVVDASDDDDELVMAVSDDKTHIVALLESELERRRLAMRDAEDPMSMPTGRRDPRRASMFGRNHSSAVDKVGRFALSKVQMDHVGINKECVFEGMGEYFLIYDPQTYQDMIAVEEPGFDLDRELGLK